MHIFQITRGPSTPAVLNLDICLQVIIYQTKYMRRAPLFRLRLNKPDSQDRTSFLPRRIDGANQGCPSHVAGDSGTEHIRALPRAVPSAGRREIATGARRLINPQDRAAATSFLLSILGSITFPGGGGISAQPGLGRLCNDS